MAIRTVSILKECQAGEHRVILLPKDIALFCQRGFEVLVETGAGMGVGQSDRQYTDAGARVVEREEAWRSAALVLKYKPPLPDEWQWLRRDMHLGAIFHAEGDPTLVKVLLTSGVTAYSYEFFRSEEGHFPLAAPGGEIAGKLAVIYGAYHLQRHLGGSGVLLAEIAKAKKPKVLVIGYGNVGGAAAQLAIAMGAEVTVLGRSQEGLRHFQESLAHGVRVALCSREVLKRELPDTDLLIGAILISTYDTEPIVDDELVRCMRRGSMIIDVTCGYGIGYLSSFDRPTELEHPVYEKHGVLHCKIDRLPAAVPTTTTEAYSATAAPYLIRLAEAVYGDVVDPVSQAGKILEDGQIVHPILREHMDYYKRTEQGAI